MLHCEGRRERSWQLSGGRRPCSPRGVSQSCHRGLGYVTGEREEITLSFEQNSGLFIQAGRCVVGWLVVYKGQRKVILIWKTVHERHSIVPMTSRVIDLRMHTYLAGNRLPPHGFLIRIPTAWRNWVWPTCTSRFRREWATVMADNFALAGLFKLFTSCAAISPRKRTK